MYALDWRLLPSLSFVESSGGKAARNNNLFGWDSGRAAFSSAAAGIRAVASSLSEFRAVQGQRYGRDTEDLQRQRRLRPQGERCDAPDRPVGGLNRTT